MQYKLILLITVYYVFIIKLEITQQNIKIELLIKTANNIFN